MFHSYFTIRENLKSCVKSSNFWRNWNFDNDFNFSLNNIYWSWTWIFIMKLFIHECLSWNKETSKNIFISSTFFGKITSNKMIKRLILWLYCVLLKIDTHYYAFSFYYFLFYRSIDNYRSICRDYLRLSVVNRMIIVPH